MQRIFGFVNKEFSKISEAAFVLGLFTFMSQILGIVRDRLLAGSVGPGEVLDVYYAAFRIPDLIFALGASLVSVSILMPFLKTHITASKKAGKDFINEVFTAFFGFIIVVSILVSLFMPFLAAQLFSGFSPEALDEVVRLSRIMLLSPVLLGISNLFATITQTFKRFFVYALAPVFYNIGIIVGITVFYPMFGLIGFAYGVVLGALLHMGIQLPAVVRLGFLPALSQKVSWQRMKSVLKHSLPRTLTLSLSKIVFLVMISLASTLSVGAISVFNLSYNLQSVPLAIIGVSYSVAAFPTLVEFFNSSKLEKFQHHVLIPIKQIMFWSLPVVALFIVLRAQIVRVILGTGNFDWSDTRLTAASLALFIISVVAQSVVLLLIRAYYAAGMTWKPLKLTMVSSAISIAGAYLLVYLFEHNEAVQMFFERGLRIVGIEGSVVTMLALAYSLGMFLNVLLLWHAFKKDFNYVPRFGLQTTIVQSLSASLLVGLASYLTLRFTVTYFDQSRVIDVFAHGFIAGMVGIVVGIVALLLMKNKEIGYLLSSLKGKISRTVNTQEGLN